MLPLKFVRKLPFELRSDFLPLLPLFSKVLHDGLRLLLHFLHKGSHDHSLALYFLHESLKFIKIIREKNRHIHITYTPSFHLFNRVVGWIPLLLCWRFHQVFYLFHQDWNSSFLCSSTTSDSKFGDSTVVLPLNLGVILQQKWVPPWNMHNYIKTQKDV